MNTLVVDTPAENIHRTGVAETGKYIDFSQYQILHLVIEHGLPQSIMTPI